MKKFENPIKKALSILKEDATSVLRARKIRQARERAYNDDSKDSK